MKKFQSLKFDLLIDLSLLTFCALVLSEGLLILFLRIEMAKGLGEISPAYLRNTHESFTHSDRFREWTKSGASSAELQVAFQDFFKNSRSATGWSAISLSLEPAESGRQDEISSKVHRTWFMIPTIVAYEYKSPALNGLIFKYEWSLEAFQDSMSHLKWRVLFLALLVEIVLVVLGYWILFKRNVLQPISNLSEISRSFLEGDWSKRCPVERQDELGQVAEALNEMAKKIQEKEKKLVLSIESLKKANEEIELAQNEQLQIEKLASIGRLAAGVAHEVGNPLGAISGYVDILRRALQKAQGISAVDIDLLDRIETETNRISKIIRALLQQARPTKERIRPVKVKPVVIRSVALAQIPQSIEVVYEFDDEDAEIVAEEDQLVQVFLNLCINAKHAIEAKKNRTEPGRLKIRCSSRKLPVYRGTGNDLGEFDTSVVRALKPESYWVTSFEDNGVGISDEDQKKLFEPFFSTKAPGKGTGLGLYVTKSIIESFRGAIVLRSALGYGTSFSIFLPRSQKYSEIGT